MEKNYDLIEAIGAYENFIKNNSVDNSINMTVEKQKELNFLLENFNYCFNKQKEKITSQYTEKNVNEYDSVYKILKKFVVDCCIGSDFDMLSDKQVMNILKNWWNINKNKFNNK